VPKPVASSIPLLITGRSGQTLEWIAENGDGWLYYPQPPERQKLVVDEWRNATKTFKPFSQSLYIDLAEDENAKPTPIHLGYRVGRNHLINHLSQLQDIGVNHVIFNLKYGKRPAEEVMKELGQYVVPRFPKHAV